MAQKIARVPCLAEIQDLQQSGQFHSKCVDKSAVVLPRLRSGHLEQRKANLKERSRRLLVGNLKEH
ncbi:MAG: hypothetical protein ACRBBJ_07665 [Rhodomicrobiaceae bacterium]